MSLGEGSTQSQGVGSRTRPKAGTKARRRLLQGSLSLIGGLALVCLLPFTSFGTATTLSSIVQKVEKAAPQLTPVLRPVANAIPSSSSGSTSTATHSTSSTTTSARPAASGSA